MWCTGLLLVILTADAQLTQSQRREADSYTAAVVEYASPLLPQLSADQVLESNAAAYLQYMGEAALNQVDIIVFPEGGLHGRNRNKFVNIPSPTERIAPCEFNTSYHPAVAMLSCGARASNLYLVVNLNEAYFNLTTNQTEFYNSNVAFDRNGTVIGRYRKFNPYGEAVTKPTSPDHHIFETDFGVSFGMFTCFDIEFLEPAIVLARDYGVKHFVFPNCWLSELPFLTALQAQWGWAFSLDVVLLAAGCNNPSAGGSGSGIYHGRHGPLQAFQTNILTSKLLIANVSKSFDCDDDGRAPTFVLDKEPTSEELVEVRLLGEAHQPTTPPRVSDGTYNGSLAMLKDYLSVYKTHPLMPEDHCQKGQQCTVQGNSSLSISLSTETTLCHNDFCCDFKVEMTTTFSATSGEDSRQVRGDDFTHQFYRLVVFDGVRWYGGGLATGGVQVCGIVSCVNDSVSSCGLRADDPGRQPRTYGQLYQTATVFHKISLTPTFLYNNSFVYPDILVTGTGDEFGRLLPSNKFTYEEFGPYNDTLLCSLSIDSPVADLITAAVYARQFHRDGQKRTDMSSSYNGHNYQSILVLCVIFIYILYG